MPSRSDHHPIELVEVWQGPAGWDVVVPDLGSASAPTLTAATNAAGWMMQEAYEGSVPQAIEYLVMGEGNPLCPDARGRLLAVHPSGTGDEEEVAVVVSHDDGLDIAHVSLMINGKDGPLREGYLSFQLPQVEFLQRVLAEAAERLAHRRDVRAAISDGLNPFTGRRMPRVDDGDDDGDGDGA